MRVAKYISNSGQCSRRDAEKLILDKKVEINGIICAKPNINVSSQDIIKVNGKIIKLINNLRLWKIYKPIKIICSNKDNKMRKTLFELIPDEMPRVISIGRLDYMSEGLILLTNNGDFARKLELPSSNIERNYKVYLKNSININEVRKINNGITIDNLSYKKINAQILVNSKNNSIITFRLKEGKNREIRKICKFFNWKIVKLIRTHFGSINCQDLKPGQIEEIDEIPKEFND
ncbi:MAG: Ribosomal large subunit pseudouridine synthase B [Alphaproteobacteria bacterium MarineAlpha5_Bin9]|nr:MAG: Ribosomal large subunit pseudouridine synthase B [Alphaproteobacteria bacterium MarineAlpha5_Bin9]